MAENQLYEGPTQDYAIFSSDPNGYILTWNEGAVRMKQYSPEEAIGKHYSMLYPEEANEEDAPMDHLRVVACGGEPAFNRNQVWCSLRTYLHSPEGSAREGRT